MDIDCTDCAFEIYVGGRTRRSLIRHFSTFLKQAIHNKGFNANDPELFDQDMIEEQAWRMAELAIDEMKRSWRTAQLAINNMKRSYDDVRDVVSGSAQEFAETYFADWLPQIESEYLSDDLTSIDALIELASGHFPEIR